jgi:hypothetical protein
VSRACRCAGRRPGGQGSARFRRPARRAPSRRIGHRSPRFDRGRTTRCASPRRERLEHEPDHPGWVLGEDDMRARACGLGSQKEWDPAGGYPYRAPGEPDTGSGASGPQLKNLPLVEVVPGLSLGRAWTLAPRLAIRSLIALASTAHRLSPRDARRRVPGCRRAKPVCQRPNRSCA